MAIFVTLRQPVTILKDVFGCLSSLNEKCLVGTLRSNLKNNNYSRVNSLKANYIHLYLECICPSFPLGELGTVALNKLVTFLWVTFLKIKVIYLKFY